MPTRILRYKDSLGRNTWCYAHEFPEGVVVFEDSNSGGMSITNAAEYAVKAFQSKNPGIEFRFYEAYDMETFDRIHVTESGGVSWTREPSPLKAQ